MAFYTSRAERAELLRAMDLLVRSFNDEELTFPWLMGGVPDGADEDDFYELSDDEEAMAHCCDLFTRLVSSDSFKESGFFY